MIEEDIYRVVEFLVMDNNICSGYHLKRFIECKNYEGLLIHMVKQEILIKVGKKYKLGGNDKVVSVILTDMLRKTKEHKESMLYYHGLIKKFKENKLEVLG